jgi:hypothetical protein
MVLQGDAAATDDGEIQGAHEEIARREYGAGGIKDKSNPRRASNSHFFCGARLCAACPPKRAKAGAPAAARAFGNRRSDVLRLVFQTQPRSDPNENHCRRTRATGCDRMRTMNGMAVGTTFAD